MIKEGNRLDGLAQTHLISEDCVAAMIPRLDQPVQALQLIASEKFIIPVDRNIIRTILMGFFLHGNIKRI